MTDADFAAWKTIRSLSATAAEGTSAPSANLFVNLRDGATPRVEVRVRSGSLGGSPTSVTLGVWRYSGGSVDKLGTIVIASGDIATPIPQLFEAYDPIVYVTVESFAGGTSPNITATVEARAVAGG